MEINKRGTNGTKGCRYSRYPFAVKYGSYFNISGKARDAILPHRFVKVYVEEGGIRIIPTDDTNSYKFCYYGQSMAKITYCYANNFLPIPEKTKIPIEINDDGSLFLCVRKAGEVI